MKLSYPVGQHSVQMYTLYPSSREQCVTAEYKCQQFLHLSILWNSTAPYKHKLTFQQSSQWLLNNSADTATVSSILTSKYSQSAQLSHNQISHHAMRRCHNILENVQNTAAPEISSMLQKPDSKNERTDGWTDERTEYEWMNERINQSISQSIKTNLYSATCCKRIRGAWWQRLGCVHVYCRQCQAVWFLQGVSIACYAEPYISYGGIFCLSVCLSIHLPIRHRHWDKTKQARIMKSSPRDSPRTLVLPMNSSSRNSKGFTPNKGIDGEWGRKNFQPISGRISVTVQDRTKITNNH